MVFNGILNAHDSPHQSSFSGEHVFGGNFVCVDSTAHSSQFSGYIVLDSTTQMPSQSFMQGQALGWYGTDGLTGVTLTVEGLKPSNDPTAMWAGGGDPPIDHSGQIGLILRDKVYQGGTWDGTVLRDCTLVYRYFDPLWINYSVWYVQDASNPTLIGYRYRDPVRFNVGNYYAPMVVPSPPGKYEVRWRWQKDSCSYAHEVVQPFLSRSNGVAVDRT
jgi:hypothetical protein